jgi:hypothetical protein
MLMSLASSHDPNVGSAGSREGGRETLARRGKTITGFANVEEDVADQVVGRQVPWRIERTRHGSAARNGREHAIKLLDTFGRAVDACGRTVRPTGRAGVSPETTAIAKQAE